MAARDGLIVTPSARKAAEDEARAKVVQLVLSPAGNVLAAAKSGGSNLMGIVKEIQERLERGEEIAKVG